MKEYGHLQEDDLIYLYQGGQPMHSMTIGQAQLLAKDLNRALKERL